MAMVRVVAMICSLGMMSSCLMSQHCTEFWSLMMDWDSRMRSSFDLRGVEDWEQVCGLMVVTSGDCQSCLSVLVVAGLDMVVSRTYYRGLSGKLTRLVGCQWFFLLPASCLGAWEFKGKMVVMGPSHFSVQVKPGFTRF